MAFEKGKSGNPNGRPKRIDAAAEKARKHVDAAIDVLVKHLASDKEEVAARAAVALIERGYGKPTEFVEIDADNNHTGEVAVRGLPQLMGAVTSDIQRRRAKDAVPSSGEDKPVLPSEVSAQST